MVAGTPSHATILVHFSYLDDAMCCTRKNLTFYQTTYLWNISVLLVLKKIQTKLWDLYFGEKWFQRYSLLTIMNTCQNIEILVTLQRKKICYEFNSFVSSLHICDNLRKSPEKRKYLLSNASPR